MIIKCMKQNLLNGVQTVFKAVPSKTTMSILECILITAKNDEITLTANDMEIGIETRIEGSVVEEGVVALEAKILYEIVRKLPENEIIIDTDDNFKTSITCEKSNFSIIGRSGDDFSYLPEIDKTEPIIISYFTLKELIRQTIFSISDNDNNIIMTGECFSVSGSECRLISLDGHRISIRKVSLKNSYEDKKVIIPGKTLNELNKILPSDMDKDVSIYFTDKHVLFEFEKTIVVSRLIEGEYFNVDQMLSSDYETKVNVNKKDLLDCIDRATLLVKEGDKKPIIISINEDNMQLKINSAVGSMNEEINIRKEGKELMIGFNPKFMIDALRVIDDEVVSLYMVNPKAPCFIKNDEESYIYLILPVNFTTVS